MAEDPTVDHARHALAAKLIQAQETIAPVYDAAEGVKADMIARGWSPPKAEAAALCWLQAVLPQALGSSK